MKKSKRGAIELSITTIIVIVLGVTLLSLGLVFVKGIFSKLNDLSGNIFDTAITEIGSFKIESKFSVPSKVEVEQGKRTSFKVIVGHDGTIAGDLDFSIDIGLSGTGGIRDPERLRVEVISEPTVRLHEGQQATFVIGVAARNDAPLTSTPFRITARANNAVYDTGAVIIEVVKGRGIF